MTKSLWRSATLPILIFAAGLWAALFVLRSQLQHEDHAHSGREAIKIGSTVPNFALYPLNETEGTPFNLSLIHI